MSYSTEPIKWAGLIYIEKRKLLTLREADKDFNLVPGGKLEKGKDGKADEDDETALRRELREELGVEAGRITQFEELLEPPKKTGDMVRFRLFTGGILTLPDEDNLPGKTVSVDFIGSDYAEKGIKVGGLLAH